MGREIEIGDVVEIIGAGVHCGDRHLGKVGTVWSVSPRDGVLVDFGTVQSSCWFPPTSIAPVDTRVDLSGLEVEQIYMAFRAIEMINEGYLQLQTLGLATETECDLEAIFEAIQRDLPLRVAQFEALNNEGE